MQVKSGSSLFVTPTKRHVSVCVHATPKPKEMISKKMVDHAFTEATKICKQTSSDHECAVQWDSAYEIYIEYVHQKERKRMWDNEHNESEDDWANFKETSNNWENFNSTREYDL